MRRGVLAGVLTVLLCMGASRAPAQAPPRLLPDAPNSDKRWVPIEALKSRGPALAAAFSPHVYVNATGERMPYRLYTPRLEPGRTYPLIVFLHGAGGGGTDNLKQLQGANMFGALTWTLPETQQRHPAFVVAPQSDVNWACTDLRSEAFPEGDRRHQVLSARRARRRRAPGLRDRGPSRGEPPDRHRPDLRHGTFDGGSRRLAHDRPSSARFSRAAVPVCGHPLPATASAVKDVPTWNFHGAADAVEPVATSRAMIDALRKAGGRPLHTEYPGVGHNVFMWPTPSRR